MDVRQRVAITGIGIISALGRGREATRQALRHGRSGIRRIESIDTSGLRCRIAGEVPRGADRSTIPGFDRFARFALIAAEEAMAQARPRDVDPTRFGVVIGTALGGCESLDVAYRRVYEERQTRVLPRTIPWSMYNAASSALSSQYGAKGVSQAITSSCASSAHAIGAAWQMIRHGQADMVLAGGTDAPLAFGIIRAWESMRVLAVDNEHPEQACRPFSADRRGLVLAEGAAVLVLERWDRARTTLGEIVGCGITTDPGHLTDPSADGASRAMRMAVGEISPGEIGYVNAHGTGTRANDPSETAAIKAVFGDRVPVSSTKSMHGHAMGASGAIEIAGSLLALNDGFLPPTMNLAMPDPECDLDYVAGAARPARVTAFLSNSLGFGGTNGVLAIRTVHGL